MDDIGSSTIFSRDFYQKNKEELTEYDKNYPLQAEKLSKLIDGIMHFNAWTCKSDVKSLIIYGKEDNLSGIRMIKYIKKIFTKCKTYELNSGYSVHKDIHERTAQIISDFLNGRVK